jgi:hypothetical protein
MATHTEGWGCEYCGGFGSITFDTRPGEGVPPVYGSCGRCGYTFGCGEDDDFTHPASYEYLETLHDINGNIYDYPDQAIERLGYDWDGDIDTIDSKMYYTKEEYKEIIENAGLNRLIGIEIWRNREYPQKPKKRSEEDFFSDEWCRLDRPHEKNRWCGYCRLKKPLYVSPFINWTINPLGEK